MKTILTKLEREGYVSNITSKDHCWNCEYLSGDISINEVYHCLNFYNRTSKSSGGMIYSPILRFSTVRKCKLKGLKRVKDASV